MIHAVTGLNGVGKTAYAVSLLRRWQAKGHAIAANIGVRGAQQVHNFDDLMGLRNCVLLLDEVTASASSRQFASLSPEALLFFQTLRHSNVGLIWTAPTYDRADLALRSLTLRWTFIRPLVTRRVEGSAWSSTLVSFVRTGWPEESQDGPRLRGAWPSLFRPARAFEFYDSFADVALFERVMKHPRACPRCGASLDYGRAKISDSATEWNAPELRACGSCGYLLPKL